MISNECAREIGLSGLQLSIDPANLLCENLLAKAGMQLFERQWEQSMGIHVVSDKLFEYLISNVSGDRFESLAKQLFSVSPIYGDEYLPLGGMHDGGADGFYLPRVWAGKKADTFFQFSVTDSERAKDKVVQTIKSLQKVGRTPRHVIYSTTEQLPKQDTLTSEIFEEFEVLLVIRDRERLRQLVNSDVQANRIFLHFFASDIDAVKDSARSLQGAVNQFVQDPTVFAFLDYELKDRFSKDHLQERILDALIYWTLRDTDPDARKFLGRQEIVESIKTVFPSATSVLTPQLNARLKELSHKSAGGEERIRHHRTRDLFCLPFEMRKELAERSIEESTLQDSFIDSVKNRLKSMANESLTENAVCLGTELVFDSIHEYFVEQGLILSAYLNNKVETIHISDQIVEDQVSRVLAKSKSKSKISPTLIADCLRVLRGIFYDPSDVERRYLGYLSRTSMLFMTLRSAPKMIEYFNQMGGNFRLLVGTDMLVKAISEQQLPAQLRQVESLLKVCNELGAKLVLTEPVLNEVFTHLHAVDLEYRNHYLPNEAYLSREEISECDRILIRAYYYARFGGGVRMSWDKFVNTLLDPTALRSKSEKGRIELQGLLMQRFRMEFLSVEELKTGVNEVEMNALADKLIEARGQKNKELSTNDALVAHAIYYQRRKRKESAIYDGFGYRTWWLTKETQVLNFTGDLVMKEGGVPYIMRPEFLLNFIALAPKAANVRDAFRQLLPTTVGLQLGQHLKPETMQQLLAGTEEWASLPPERVSVMIADKINKLKFDRYKQYTSIIQ